MATLLHARGHIVALSRVILSRGAVDQLVAQAANDLGGYQSSRQGSVVVTWDHHFRQLVNRSGEKARARFPRVGRLLFDCPEPSAAERVAEVISLVEFEYWECQKQADKRPIMEVGREFVKILR